MTTAVDLHKGRTRSPRTTSHRTTRNFPRTKTAATLMAAIRAENPLTPEQEEDYGRFGRWLHRVASIKLSTLLALALVVVGTALVLSFAIIAISEINVSNQKGDINELRIENANLNGKLTNVGVRLNELQSEIDQIRGSK